ncbi:nucleoside diphosphate-linked moiety X motif 19 [Drosophila ficusphila]|uniref:nucleoside diphosphate-linked moiety X motif 19 n=1 Tax=Drosophila ficusphila TaxID=30025 RepID=UPI0007E7F92B|nr:nucleoside diphosphate-linked moiety X motif 19 [Drosophila ficusphila]
MGPATQTGSYRPSASLILAAKEDSLRDYDYRLLLIKRTERTSYALNHCVFPGGVFDSQEDESPEWIKYFKSFGVTDEHLRKLTHKQDTPRPQFLNADKHFSRDIALRLTALRETFEEVGILICTNQNSFKNWDSKLDHPCTLLLEPSERSEWQHRVHNNASQFLELYRYLNVIPNLWSLQEWSIWRTAATANRKYDTVYYVTTLDKKAEEVSLLLEPHEVASAHWMSPAEAWTSSQDGTIWLPFMLLYDIARLMNLNRWQELLNFSRERSSRGTTMIQPVYFRCDDCMFGVLPGDELYPKDPGACTQSIILPGSVNEIHQKAQQYNRYIVYDFHQVVLASNVPPNDGHLPLQPLVNTKLSKL